MRARTRRVGALLTTVGSAAAVGLTGHSAINLRLLRRPPSSAPALPESVAVLLPVRNEGDRVRPCLQALRAVLAHDSGTVRLIVLDDDSTDATFEIVRSELAGLPGVRVLRGAPLPDGWLGKAHACDQLARAAGDVGVLAFLDADVQLAPHAVHAAVAMLRASGLDLVSPYPRQLAAGIGQRLVQPLLQWSWATTLPLRLAETSPRPSLAAANGQFLLVDAAAYRRAGGHAGVRMQVLEDLALLRAIKATGGSGGVVDGTALATCQMYRSWAELVAGYTKSLWSGFGGPVASTSVAGGLLLIWVLPAAAAVRGSRIGLLGYAAAVAGRIMVARRTGGRVLPDALAHPLSVLAFVGLLAGSRRARRRGTITWRGRPLAPNPAPDPAPRPVVVQVDGALLS